MLFAAHRLCTSRLHRCGRHRREISSLLPLSRACSYIIERGVCYLSMAERGSAISIRCVGLQTSVCWTHCKFPSGFVAGFPKKLAFQVHPVWTHVFHVASSTSAIFWSGGGGCMQRAGWTSVHFSCGLHCALCCDRPHFLCAAKHLRSISRSSTGNSS